MSDFEIANELMVDGTNVFPQLYALTSTGKVKTWQVRVKPNADGTAMVTSTYGQLGGKLTDKVEIIREGKNLGKANETTPLQQAIAEASSDYQKKIDKKYTMTIPGADDHQEADILLPMLALNYRDRAHDIVYPAYSQPKLNGVRCLAKKINDREIQFTTRKFKDFPGGVTAHLVKPLLNMMETGEVFDGEFYRHDWTFQQIVRTVKKERPWARELEFHVFDLAEKTAEFAIRELRLNAGFKTLQNPDQAIKYVASKVLTTELDVKRFHDSYVQAGYEGIIIRNAAGLYVFDHRSKDLQKYKEFVDAEFEIVGGTYETVTDPETHDEVYAVVFTCAIPEGRRFNVRPKGTVKFRSRLYANLKDIVGKYLTVRYQEMSEDFIPIFPVGLSIRDYE